MSHLPFSTRTQLDSLTGAPLLPAGAKIAVYVAYILMQWDRRHRTRRELRGLSDQMLDDIGVDRLQALREADKPFWRA